MYDIAARRDMNKTAVPKKHRNTAAKNINPWEGLEMIEDVLQEAATGYQSLRAQPLLSSPRVNPAMVEKEVTETTQVRTATFLTATETPQLRKLKEEEEEKKRLADSDEYGDASHHKHMFKPRHRAVKKRLNKSAAFTGPPRPVPGDELLRRAPPIGKYQPKYGEVEHNSGFVKMRKAPTPHHHHHHHHRHGQHHPAATAAAADKTHNSNLSVSMAEGGGGGSELAAFSSGGGEHTTTTSLGESKTYGSLLFGSGFFKGGDTPSKQKQNQQGQQQQQEQQRAQTTDPSDFRWRPVPACSSVFKSKTQRRQLPTGIDADYWPFPKPGTTTFHKGTISKRTKGRQDVSVASTTCGPNIFYYTDEKYQPKAQLLQFSRGISRDKQKISTFGSTLPPPSYNYSVNIESVKAHTPQPIAFDKQLARPKESIASTGEGLAGSVGDVVTIKKQGFVDMNRMSNPRTPTVYQSLTSTGSVAAELNPLSSSRLSPPRSRSRNQNYAAEDGNPAGRTGEPNLDDIITHRSPSPVSFAKQTERKNEIFSKKALPEYQPNLESIKPHRSVVTMRSTSRDGPVMRNPKPHEAHEVYDVTFREHTSTPNIALQVSRERRDERYRAPGGNNDAIYDLKPPKPRGIVPFVNLKPRA